MPEAKSSSAHLCWYCHSQPDQLDTEHSLHNFYPYMVPTNSDVLMLGARNRLSHYVYLWWFEGNLRSIMDFSMKPHLCPSNLGTPNSSSMVMPFRGLTCNSSIVDVSLSHHQISGWLAQFSSTVYSYWGCRIKSHGSTWPPPLKLFPSSHLAILYTEMSV
jgi:hypothetical protein